MARRRLSSDGSPPVRRRDERLEAMSAVAAEFGSKGWRPAREVLKRVQAVPTIFPQLDYKLRVGGLPLARITTVHGPTNEGKSIFTLGLVRSFLQRGHFAAYVDAEMTTPIDWCERLMQNFADHPAYVASRPRTYEETVKQVRDFCTMIGAARDKGRVPADTSGLVVIDSIRKLVPKRLLDALMKEKKGGDKDGGIDGMGGRAAQYKAALNAAWMDELVPLLAHTNTTAVLIARESEDSTASSRDRMFGNDYKVGGGKAIIYEASIAARVVRASWVYAGGEDDKRVVGERHLLDVHKTKVAGKDERRVECYFHTSNGVLVPEGFDTARDLLELARGFEMVKQSGSRLSWGRRSYNGQNQFVQKVSSDPALLAELDEQVRAGFGREEAVDA